VQGNLPKAKILFRLAVKPFVGALTMRFLGMVEAYAGRLEPIGSPRGESIFVTWSPKIFIEASAWRAYVLKQWLFQKHLYFATAISSLHWKIRRTSSHDLLQVRMQAR